MSEKSYEQFEKEAREALVASDLSAKMKQWRQTPPPANGGGKRWTIAVLLLVLAGGAGYWLRQKPEKPAQAVPTAPLPGPTPARPESPPTPAPAVSQEPMAEKKPGKDYPALVEKYYRLPDFGAEIRGGNGPAPSNALTAARQALTAHRYTEAIGLLQQAPPANLVDSDYLLAHALFGMKKYEQAAPVFRALGDSPRYGDAAQWYEALSMLPAFDKKKESVLKLLKTMARDKNHTYQREAQALLQEL